MTTTVTTIDGLPTVTINSINVASTIDPVNDLIPIYTNNLAATQAISRNTFLGTTGTLVDTSSVQTLSNKTLAAPILEGNITGWVLANETWTYASATSITVPTNATTKYSVGDKLMLTQGASVLYFYITAVAATTLTITGGSDYTLTNTTITLNYYSKVSTPLGFPQWFTYTTTFTGFSSIPTGVSSKFTINGRTCTVELSDTTPGTSNSTSKNYTLPITSAYSGGAIFGGIDNGTQYFVYHFVGSGTATVSLFIGPTAGISWTASGNCRLFNAGVNLSYGI